MCKHKCLYFALYLLQDDRLKLFLMEYPLRTLAMVAQVQAGMWRRNGYAVINQVVKLLYNNFFITVLVEEQPIWSLRSCDAWDKVSVICSVCTFVVFPTGLPLF